MPVVVRRVVEPPELLITQLFIETAPATVPEVGPAELLRAPMRMR
jgi:hypothetical protein